MEKSAVKIARRFSPPTSPVWASRWLKPNRVARPDPRGCDGRTLRAALIKDPALKGFRGRVSDSGEGRWTIRAAIDEAVPAPVLSSALYERFTSRGAADFADKLLSAMRYEFGGHLERPSQ